MSKVPILLDPDSYRYEAGKAVPMRDGHDLSIITCSATPSRSLQAADQLARGGISARVLKMSSIKPLD